MSGTPPPPPPGRAPVRLPPPPPAGEPPAAPPGDDDSFPGWVNWSGSQVLLGLFAGFFGAFLFAPALVLPFDSDLSSQGAILAAQALLGLTLAGVAVYVAGGWSFDRPRETLRRLGLRKFKAEAIGWMFAMMVAYYFLAGLFATYVLEPEQEDIGDALGVGDDTVLVAVLAVVLIVGLAPIAEELFFRGFLYGGFRKKLPIWAAAILAGLIFGSVHAPTGVTTVVPLALLGVGLCLLYEKTQSLWPSVIAHTINNGLALALAGVDFEEEGLLLPLHLPF